MTTTPTFREYTSALKSEAASGWDKFALEYSLLPQTSRVYNLHKELSHGVFEKERVKRGQVVKDMCVLDFNCGCGNDFHFFLDRGAKVYGCDGSVEMLAVAYKTYEDQVQSGQLRLFAGMSEEMQPDSFGNVKFDCIYSITGGFSYLSDEEFRKCHKTLAGMLKPNGFLMLSHLRPFCWSEIVYHLSRMRFGMAMRRLRKKIEVNVKGQSYTMHLRTEKDIEKLLQGICKTEAVYPIVTLTPPFQTKYKPGPMMFRLHRSFERWATQRRMFRSFADQLCFVSIPMVPMEQGR